METKGLTKEQVELVAQMQKNYETHIHNQVEIINRLRHHIDRHCELTVQECDDLERDGK